MINIEAFYGGRYNQKVPEDCPHAYCVGLHRSVGVQLGPEDREECLCLEGRVLKRLGKQRMRAGPDRERLLRSTLLLLRRQTMVFSQRL